MNGFIIGILILRRQIKCTFPSFEYYRNTEIIYPKLRNVCSLKCHMPCKMTSLFNNLPSDSWTIYCMNGIIVIPKLRHKLKITQINVLKDHAVSTRQLCFYHTREKCFFLSRRWEGGSGASENWPEGRRCRRGKSLCHSLLARLIIVLLTLMHSPPPPPHYYYAAFLSRHFSHKSSNSKAHTHRYELRTTLKASLKNKSIGSVIQIKINQCSS